MMGAKKKLLKRSEARIMVYLESVDNTEKYVTAISNHLKIDYVYLLRILRQMLTKGWLKIHHFNNKTFYDLACKAPIDKAKQVLSDYQHTLKN
jgi:predicted transcriptional regulator